MRPYLITFIQLVLFIVLPVTAVVFVVVSVWKVWNGEDKKLNGENGK